MESWVQAAVHWFLLTFSLPEFGLSAIFIVSFVSATLLPLGSEPAVFGYLQLAPTMFWPAVVVATVGNTLGGIVSYWMGWAAHNGYERWQEHQAKQTAHAQAQGVAPPKAEAQPKHTGRWHHTVQAWFHKLGPAALLLSWLPIVGDPLCSVAGWLRLPLGLCTVYMAIGKFLRYVLMTAFLLWLWPMLLPYFQG